jgi:hypothetical protein
VYAVNTERTLVAHSEFDAAPNGGVHFRKLTTRVGHVLDVGPLWLDPRFDEYYKEMSAIEADLDKLINQLKRGEPPEEWFTYNVPDLPMSPLRIMLELPDPEPGGS